MDKKLKLFVLGKLRAMRKAKSGRLVFFSVLKHSPDALKEIILRTIGLWAQEYADKRYRVVLLTDEKQASSEIIESLKKRFAYEMAKIT